MSGISTDPGFNRKPKYEAYEVFDFYTDEILGVYSTRAEAETHKTAPSHRVRGSFSKPKKVKEKKARKVPPIRASRDRRLPGKARIRARRS